ncbi:MAG: hypothetical protein OXU20_16040 [Myxococcales bacterium]|nr:hypothetical protein [Myxococcales bacterium]
MPIVARNVQENADGYREVSLEYRRARSAALDARTADQTTDPGVGSDADARKERIACPMLDACRSTGAYGEKALRATDKRHLNPWSRVLGIPAFGIRAVGYLSGPWYRIWSNAVHGRFDAQQLNGGFLRSFKHGINTGVLARGSFSQEELDQLVWSFQPELKGVSITTPWIHGPDSAGYYLTEAMLPAVLAHNETNADPGMFGRRLGLALSTFEMKSLLLGPLAQTVSIGSDAGSQRLKAISVRDLHDFYKQGWLPVQIEERFSAAGFLAIADVQAMPASRNAAGAA